MMECITDVLIEKILEKKNPSVVGLDTRLEYVPGDLILAERSGGVDLDMAADAIFEFNRRIIDAVYEHIPAIKIQIACYEMYGIPGLEVFSETVKYAKSKGLIVIGDVKRNDIGSTAQAYSSAYLGETCLCGGKVRAFDVDFATVNPYFGIDGVKPFIEDCRQYGKGIFVLVKTSNPSSGEIQDLETKAGKKVYEVVAEKVNEWGRGLEGCRGYSSIGAVVGATYPHEGRKLRHMMPHAFFLVPGYGMQGGGADDVIGCFDENGLGAVINASRSIICAWRRQPWKGSFTPAQFAEAARAEVLRMRADIEAAMERRGVRPW